MGGPCIQWCKLTPLQPSRGEHSLVLTVANSCQWPVKLLICGCGRQGENNTLLSILSKELSRESLPKNDVTEDQDLWSVMDANTLIGQMMMSPPPPLTFINKLQLFCPKIKYYIYFKSYQLTKSLLFATLFYHCFLGQILFSMPHSHFRILIYHYFPPRLGLCI